MGILCNYMGGWPQTLEAKDAWMAKAVDIKTLPIAIA